ncbi:unnamed protein product, partial [marine sediment metagenome]
VELRLHIFNPSGLDQSDKRPAIVFFFGGGWVSGSPGQFFPHCQYLASRGMVAISAEYRVKNRHGTTPLECVADGKSAVRWVRTHAGELGVDPDRIAAGGGSAGGHVAASAGIVQGLDEEHEDASVSSVPNALVLFNPVVDLSVVADRFGERGLAISPVRHVREDLPPTIIFHGTADQLVPIESVERFCEKMTEAGNRCELVKFEGRPHAFFNYGTSKEDYADTVRRADRFLTSLGYLEGDATI